MGTDNFFPFCPSGKEIIDFLKGKVAKYKFPARFEFLKELPLTATMKVKKGELKKRYGGTH